MPKYSKDQLRKIFQSPFNQEAWKAILHNLFRADKIRMKPELFTDPEDNEVGYHMGVMDTSDNYHIGLFYYKVKSGSVAHKKVGLRNLVRSLLNPTWGMFDAAIVVFDSNPEWRLSFVCDIKEHATAPKRFTFVFGEPSNHYRTPVERFDRLQNHDVTFDNIRQAFSVEALSDDFFRDYRDLYADFVEYISGKRYVKEGGKWVERKISAPHSQYASSFGGKDKLVRDYVKKMFGRIVFLYFLQRKGWLNDNRNYMHDLFYLSDKKDDFLEKVLEPLFFEVLNTDKPYRTEAARALPGSNDIPYLNGGLFEQDEIDERTCIFPEKLFARLFAFLDSYNFTIDENDTEDAEIGIDPEMLGRIFENLLEDNKDKGAFYTPKEIVSYMCRESIIAYLQEDRFSSEGNDLIRKFVETLDDTLLSKEQRVCIKDKLKSVKICDLAIGSGAFPMGLVNLLSKLYAALRISSEASVIKRHIMEQSIYGVDIEQGAVDIARLRFWLAMIVEEKEPMPLPNLHFKIMQGNSLLECYNGVDLSDLTKVNRFGDIFDQDNTERETLVSALREYYNTSDHKRRDRLFNEIINNVRRQLFAKQVTLPAGIDPSANTDFFLWHTWFSDVFANGGFDIVIGNPPYVSAPAQVANEKLRKQRESIIDSKYYATLYQKWDLYIPFMERGLKMLRPDGCFSMIVPYPLSNQGYGMSFRKWVSAKFNIFEIVDLNGTKIFDNATVSNLIMFASNRGITSSTIISNIDDNREIVKKFEQPLSALFQDDKKAVWNFSPETKDKNLHSDMNVLGDFCYISVGMVLNADEKTSKGLFRKEDLISDVCDSLHPRKYIEAKDLEKYRVKRERYLEYDTPRCPGQLRRPTFRELYDRPKLIFNRLGSMQVFFDATDFYLLSDSTFLAIKWADLKDVSNKSILSSIKRYSRFDRSKMERLSCLVTLEYLLAILNSKYASYLLSLQRGGDYHIYPEHLRNLPIPIAPKCVQEKLRLLTEKLRFGNDEQSQRLIDHIVYHLYGLTYDEVMIVDPETPISREEYENFNIKEVSQN